LGYKISVFVSADGGVEVFDDLLMPERTMPVVPPPTSIHPEDSLFAGNGDNRSHRFDGFRIGHRLDSPDPRSLLAKGPQYPMHLKPIWRFSPFAIFYATSGFTLMLQFN
jgi:hypothetical protein